MPQGERWLVSSVQIARLRRGSCTFTYRPNRARSEPGTGRPRALGRRQKPCAIRISAGAIKCTSAANAVKPVAHSLRTTVAAVAVVVACGCRHHGGATTFALVDPARIEPARGEGRIALTKGRTVFIEARPVEPLVHPVCPRGRLFDDGAVPVTLVARVQIDDEGRVRSIERSVADFSMPTRFSAACLRAVELAVAQWRFHPAQFAHVDVRDDRPATVISAQRTDTIVDIPFTFSPSSRVQTALSRN